MPRATRTNRTAGALERRPERLRLTPRSAVLAVALFGMTLAALGVLAASQRVLGWMTAAAAIAGLLHPTVVALDRRLPRGVALAIVAVATIVAVGGVAYGVGRSLVTETRHLQEAVPRRAAQLEEGRRFGGLARDLRLSDRSRRVVREIPQRLQGGTPAEAVRAAATRGVAFLATGVFTLFLLLHGSRLVIAGLGQIEDDKRRERAHRVVRNAYRRGFGYARGTIAMAAIAGLLAYALGLAANVPGPAPLALWAAMFDVIPFGGAFIGALPIVVFAGASSTPNAVLLVVAFAAYQVFEAIALQRRVDRGTIRVGPFLTTAAIFGGLELYGIGGALLSLLALAVALAALDELAPA